jgi:hypothetical protein
MDDYRDQECTGHLFGGGSVRWRVGALIDWAKVRGIRSVMVEAAPLAAQFEHCGADEPVGSPAFVRRARETDLDAPIILCMRGEDWIVADGLHRLWKAVYIERRRQISAYVLPLDELPCVLG